MKKLRTNQWMLVGLLIGAIALLNIIRVIMGAFQTPPGQVYLAIGHSYLDYLEYTQHIAQGIYGHTQILNQFTTHDPTHTLIGWGQYLLIGYCARMFHASPFFAYWAAVFLLSVAVLSVTFLVIRKLLSDQPFFSQIIAFLFAVFAVPFVTIAKNQQTFTVKPIEFFYSPISMFHRIGGVPHHLTTALFISISLLLTAHILTHVGQKTRKWFFPETGILIILLVATLTFAPLQVFTYLSAVGIVAFGYALWHWKKEKSLYKSTPFFLFLILLFITMVPAALLVNQAHAGQELFVRAIAWERTQQYHASALELLATIGPILLLMPFGLFAYFKRATPLRLILFTYMLFSYLYFFTDLAYFFGTFNQRFLTPVSYVFFGVTALLGIRTITDHVPFKKIISTGIMTLFLLYFVGMTLSILRSFGGSDELGYMPKDFFTGVRILNLQNDTKAVLTSSYRNLGILIPSIVDRNVYLGRMIFTPEYVRKQDTSDQFYVGNMSPVDAYQFLKENNIGYILVSSIEPYPKENMLKYPFISELYENPFLTILQFHE